MEASKADVLRLGEAVVVRLRRLTARPLHLKNVARAAGPELQALHVAGGPTTMQAAKSSEKELGDLKVNVGQSAGDVKSPEAPGKANVGPPSVLTQPIRPCQRRI